MKELELFSLDGLGGWFGRNRHSFVPAPGQKCLNCETELAGRYCHQCGQDADTHHRTIGHLVFEAFEGLFHVDGRLWQTLPPLFFAPGKLARDLMEGRVARHVPPFRIFLVALLVLMFVAEQHAEKAREVATPNAPTFEQLENLTVGPDGKPTIKNLPANVHVTTVVGKDGKREVNVVRNIELISMTGDDARYLAGMIRKEDLKPAWLKADLLKALDNPERFMASVFTWGHRLALLLLPIVGLFLAMLYSGKKYKGRYYLYDHLLVAMNLLSFIFLVNAATLLLPEAPGRIAGGFALLWTLVNFFQTLRGAYGSTIWGAIVKSVVLWVLTSFAFGVVILGVMAISLAA